MGTIQNIEAVRRFYSAGPSIDDGERFGFASPEIVWHVPGENRVSGDYRGAEAVFRTLSQRMLPLDQWDIDVVDIMANADLVMATVRVRARRYGRAVETTGGHLFRFDTAGLIVEAWGFTADQAALDELLDPA